MFKLGLSFMSVSIEYFLTLAIVQPLISITLRVIVTDNTNTTCTNTNTTTTQKRTNIFPDGYCIEKI